MGRRKFAVPGRGEQPLTGGTCGLFRGPEPVEKEPCHREHVSGDRRVLGGTADVWGWEKPGKSWKGREKEAVWSSSCSARLWGGSSSALQDPAPLGRAVLLRSGAGVRTDGDRAVFHIILREKN